MNGRADGLCLPEPTRAGTLLNGRVQYRQFATGYRTGIEPVFLAAAIPARPGEHVLEAGSGAGAALLCLATRIPAISGTGIERDPALAALANANAAANGYAALGFAAGAIEAYRPARPVDHAMANPPWHAASGTASPDPGRTQAKRASPALLDTWITALSDCLRSGGTLTLILPAAQLDCALAALPKAGCGSLAVLPLWPRQGTAARLVLVQARRNGRAACVLHPGIALHGPGGLYTEAAEQVLRHGAALTSLVPTRARLWPGGD